MSWGVRWSQCVDRMSLPVDRCGALSKLGWRSAVWSPELRPQGRGSRNRPAWPGCDGFAQSGCAAGFCRMKDRRFLSWRACISDDLGVLGKSDTLGVQLGVRAPAGCTGSAAAYSPSVAGLDGAASSRDNDRATSNMTRSPAGGSWSTSASSWRRSAALSAVPSPAATMSTGEASRASAMRISNGMEGAPTPRSSWLIHSGLEPTRSARASCVSFFARRRVAMARPIPRWTCSTCTRDSQFVLQLDQWVSGQSTK